MRLLNLACGATRPGAPWVNLDQLRSVLKPGTPERTNLDTETNYIDADITQLPLPFAGDQFDGILASHCVEHWDCQQAAAVLGECRRALAPGGLLVVSVPDADYFLSVIERDWRESAPELFGEPISPDEPWQEKFFDYALFNRWHKQILNAGALRCLLVRAEFCDTGYDRIFNLSNWKDWEKSGPFKIDHLRNVKDEIEKIMNRRKFSLELCAVK